MLLNDDAIKKNADVIILTMWIMLKFLLKSKDVLYQASIDLDEVNSFNSSSSDAVQKAPCLSKVLKSLPGTGLKRPPIWVNCISYPRFINAYLKFQVDQWFQTMVLLRKKFLSFGIVSVNRLCKKVVFT